MKQEKTKIGLPILMAIMVIIGMFLGFKMKESMPNNKFFSANNSNNSMVQQVIDIIKKNYIDTLSVDSLEYFAINELVSKLDPHSEFLPASLYKHSMENLTGSFAGIGVEYKVIADTVVFSYIDKDGPSFKAGLQIGDKLLTADGKNMTGDSISNDKIKNAIRGELHSTVELTILRNGKSQNFKVTRGNIHSKSVAASYMMDQKTGFIKLNIFSENAYKEFMQSLEALQKQGMQELIFDLRGNGGGYLEKAVDIADEFLDGDKLIVYTEGAHQKKKEYRCKRPGLFEKGKLIVLVDELSASASEILCGALQDWDRATIIGRRTFGKGLVQVNYQLSDGSALKLTTAQYYTPLGRSIQKPFDSTKASYIHEVLQRYYDGGIHQPDSATLHSGKVFTTPKGKKLYQNIGGIMPDIIVTIDTTSLSKPIQKLFYKGSLHDYVFQYYIQHASQIESLKSTVQLSSDKLLTSQLYQGLNSWASKDTVSLNGISTKEKSFLDNRMLSYLARYKWREQGYYEIYNQQDKTVLKAIEFLKNQ